jgi:hypothetical protein
VPESNENERENRKVTYIIYAVIGLVSIGLILGVVWLKRQPKSVAGPEVQPHLEGAIRSGSPEFDKLMENIKLDKPEATVDQTAIGGISMSLYTHVRNFTGKTITGLEMKGTVVDEKKLPVKSKVIIVIPKFSGPLPNNGDLPVRILVEGFKDTDDRANIKMEITGLKVE